MSTSRKYFKMSTNLKDVKMSTKWNYFSDIRFQVLLDF
ncbi:hypothetical protein Mgra_00008483, partial [Meloidogyne graminicola]